MHATIFTRVALASALSILCAPAADAGGGHGGGAVFHAAGGPRSGLQGRAGWGGARFGGQRGLPPVAGVIHERPGVRPYVSAYGHTGTALRYAGGGGGGLGYGHVGTALRYGGERRFGAFGLGRRRYAGRGGFVGEGFGGGYGYGGGTYGGAGTYGDAGVYGGQGTYGQPGTYGQAGTYGALGTTATQVADGPAFGATYRSETPLAARFAEAPLGPSPYAPYSPADRYAYAASEDVRPGPRVVNPFRAARSDCACEGRSQPVFYRYGIGTAY